MTVSLDIMSTCILVMSELKPVPVSMRRTPPAALPVGVPLVEPPWSATPASERMPLTLRLLAFVA